MQLKHHKVLLRNRVYLLEELELGNILHHLLQDVVINDDLYQQVEAEKTRKAKVTVLLDRLPRCGPKAFNSFIRALKEHQPHVAQKLLESPGHSEDDDDEVFK